jgi:uncharacterized protein YjdB
LATSNSNIVSVSEQGLLTAKATGVVTLYAQTYNGLIATREITVKIMK